MRGVYVCVHILSPAKYFAGNLPGISHVRSGVVEVVVWSPGNCLIFPIVLSRAAAAYLWSLVLVMSTLSHIDTPHHIVMCDCVRSSCHLIVSTISPLADGGSSDGGGA